MASPDKWRDELNDYLRQSRHTMLASDQPVTLVIGNEAADLDSCVSSVLYAFVLSRDARSSDVPVVPVLNLPRADLSLRPDAQWLLAEAGLDVGALLFTDEADPVEAYVAGRVRGVVLTDHNRLASSQEALLPAVVDVLDHHVDEGMYPATATTRIELVGSCCTLVAQAMMARRTCEGAMASPAVALLLQGAVLLDTANLDAAQQRATAADVHVAAAVAAAAGGAGAAAGEARPADAVYDALRARRFDVSRLSTRDLLRKDYKQWQMGDTRVGVASVGMDLRAMAAKDAAMADACAHWSDHCGLDLLVVMGSYYEADDSFRRQLILLPARAHSSLTQQLVEHLDRAVGLTALQVSGLPDAGAAFWQTDATQSRKKLQPLLAKFFRALDAAL